MSKQALKYIQLVYGIVLSLLLVATGILLMVSCVNIYNIGNRPFTPESISAAFSKIAIPVWITVGAVIVGLVLKLFLPTEKKLTAVRDNKILLLHLQKRINTDTCNEATRASIQKEQRLRTVLRIVAIVLCVAAAAPAVIYAVNFNHFSADYNASVISACLWILPCSMVAMGICLLFVYLENASLARQIGHVKSALAESKGTYPADTAKGYRSPVKLVTVIRIVLAVAALVFIVVGIFNGGMADVLSKAINICTECIGLG